MQPKLLAIFGLFIDVNKTTAAFGHKNRATFYFCHLVTLIPSMQNKCRGYFVSWETLAAVCLGRERKKVCVRVYLGR